MRDMYAWIACIHALLFIAAMGYAKFLNQPHVHEAYSPNYVWVTVVGGDILIGLAFGALWIIGVFPLIVLALYISLHVAAGLPIVYWQQQRALKRARDLEAIEKGP
jgi:hypothetical protein